MRIRRIAATPVNLPLEAPYEWVFGYLPGFSVTIVTVETEDGIVGYGETPSPGAAAIIERMLAPALVGLDARDRAACEERALPAFAGVQSTADRARIAAFGAIEMALRDIAAKAAGVPLYLHLGGAVRKAIPFTDYFAFRADGDGVKGETTPEAVADYCQRLHEEHGTTFFEGKVSTADPAPSLRMLEAIRRRLGEDAMIRIDSNQAYSLATARRITRPLEDLGVRNWEDPVRTAGEMVELRRHCSIPFSTHNVDLAAPLAHRCPDAICSTPSVLGGIGRMQRFVGACEHAGIDFWCYSGDSGIGSAFYLHLCAATAWIREPNQSLFRMQPFDIIEEGPFAPKNNVVSVPEGPGIGVTLSADRLAHAHRRFVEDGPFDKYHDPARPNTFRRLPLS
jgi:glucarate dehydratase